MILIRGVVFLSLAVIASGCRSFEQLNAKDLRGQSVVVDLSVAQWLGPPPSTKGKFVLLDFWRTTCPPCIGNIKKLNSFHQKFGDNLAVIALSPESAETIERVRSAMKIEYSLAIDESRNAEYHVFGVKRFPNVAILDPNGVVRWQGNPSKKAHDLTEEKIAKLISDYSRNPKETL